MKKERVGDITTTGGFSRLLNDVVTTQRPVAISRREEVVGILLPCNDILLQMYELITVSTFEKERHVNSGSVEESYLIYLMNQAMVGEQAKFLLEYNFDYDFSTYEQRQREIVQELMKKHKKVSSEGAGNAGEQPVAPLKGSKRDTGTVKRSPIRKKKK
jgi:hypothetical protein